MKTILLIVYLFSNGGGMDFVNHSDMGTDWKHTDKCLVRFAKSLSKELGKHIQPMFGVRNAEALHRYKGLDEEWDRAAATVDDCWDPDA